MAAAYLGAGSSAASSDIAEAAAFIPTQSVSADEFDEILRRHELPVF